MHHSAFDETPGSRAVVIALNLLRPLFRIFGLSVCDDITVPFYWAVRSGCSQPAAPSLQVWWFLHCTWPARSPAQGWWASPSLLTLLRERINCCLFDDPYTSYSAITRPNVSLTLFTHLQNYWSSHQPQLYFLFSANLQTLPCPNLRWRTWSLSCHYVYMSLSEW